jgi:hypothetical protein
LPIQPGQTLLHYRIVDKLGEGGMGAVHRAEDTRLGREIAIKVMPAELAGDAERRRRFEQEARAVAALKHPNIVTVYSTARRHACRARPAAPRPRTRRPGDQGLGFASPSPSVALAEEGGMGAVRVDALSAVQVVVPIVSA